MRFFRLLILLFLVAILAALASRAARFLVVDHPEKSDVIVVLAGDTQVRPVRGLEMLRQGMAPRLLLDGETREVISDQPLVELVQRYVNSLDEATRVSVCPITGYSTIAESAPVSRCFQSLAPQRAGLR